MGIGSRIGKSLGPNVGRVAPGMTSAFVHEALERAINGVGPLPGAASAAEKQLAEQKGNVDRAVHEVIENHVRWAGAQGFVTNIGGLVTLAVTIPTNITGLALLQCRMVAGVAHLRGYDLNDPRVRNGILAAVLGEETVLHLIKKKQLPGTPMAIATAPAYDADLDKVMAAQVATAMVTKVAGKKLATIAGKRVPVIGGMIGAGTDAYSTWKVGRYVEREFLPRRR
ncbi:MAG: EcsC family protein [Marmoricola sp.]